MKITPTAMFEVFALLAFAAAPATATTYTFTQLPISAGGLNDLGQIVGLAPTPYPYGGLPVVYSNGTVTSLGFGPNQFPAGSVAPIAINNTGLIVADTAAGNTTASIIFKLGTTTAIGGTSSATYITAENNKGEVVGSYPPFGPGVGVVPSPYNGVFNRTFPTGINDTEQVVGHFIPQLNFGNPLIPPNYIGIDQGFLLSGGVYTTFTIPGALETDPVAINNSGEIVGTFADATGTHGFEEENGVFSTIVGPNGGDFLPLGLNNLGQIIGISSPGQNGVSYFGTPQAVPEPSTFALLSAGLVGLLGWRSRSGSRHVR